MAKAIRVAPLAEARPLDLPVRPWSRLREAPSGAPGADVVTGDIVVPHFSGAATGPTVADLCARARAARADARTAAEKITGEVQVPSPPSFTVQCLDSQVKTKDLVSLYVRTVQEPERTAISRLLGTARVGALACDEDWTSDIDSLLTRWDKKIDKLIALPQSPETANPIVRAEFALQYSLDLLGDESRHQASFADAGKRAAKATTELLRRLRSEHDYMVVDAVWVFLKTQALTVPDFDHTAAVDQFLAAYRFKVDLALEADEDYPGSTNANGNEFCGHLTHIAAEGSGTFGLPTNFTHPNSPLSPYSISMKTTAYSLHYTPMPSTTDYYTWDLATGGTYTPQFTLSFNACDEASTYVRMDRLGSHDEDTCHWKETHPDAPDNDSEGTGVCGNEAEVGAIFSKYYGSEVAGLYSFHPSIKNRNAQAMKQDFSGVEPSPTSGAGTLSITVTHAPR
ncbi:MAG: hypothetical protein JW940_38430 [Polyangiaceae bacterium]|nr:hypothetical protein [Polyangiaceae bacterium]